jgi:hypothetical protein
VSGIGIPKHSILSIEDSIPNGEIEAMLIFRGESHVQRGKHLVRAEEIGVRERSGTESVQDGDRQKSGTDSMARDIEKIHCEVSVVGPVITEGVSAKMSGRNVDPVGSDITGVNRRRDQGNDVTCGTSKLALKRLPALSQGFIQVAQFPVLILQLDLKPP